MKNSFKYLMLLAFSTLLMSQDFGTISGKVYDKEYGDPIIGAYVMISGMSIGSTTDIDGKFSFKTPVGVYDLKIEYIGYNTVTIKQITVVKDKSESYNVALDQSVNASDVVVIEAKTFQNNETGLLVAQKKSEKMFDAISAEQITKSGDSNLGEALKKVTGLTIVGGKNVFVRGLGERYSNVQLNGSVLPSTNPDKKEVPMDIFSSSVVDNIIVQKAYTADQPGEFSGGSVQIKTKEFPEETIIKAGYSTSVNDNDLGDDYLSSDEGSTDWLGFAGSTRSLPSSLSDLRVSDLNINEKQSVVGSLTQKWTPNRTSVIPNQSFSFTYGNNYSYTDESQLGVISNVKYSRKNSANSKTTQDVLGKGNEIQEGEASADLTGMMNIFYKKDAETKIGLKNFFTNSGENSAKEIFTYDGQKDANYRQTVHKFVQSQLFSSTLLYETYFSDFYTTKLKTDITYASTKRDEPNTRNTHYTLNETTNIYSVNLSDRGNKHYYSDQTDRNFTSRFDFESNFFKNVKTKFGMNYLYKKRDFDTRQFHYERFFGQIYSTEFLTSEANEIFNADNIAETSSKDKIRFLENFNKNNSYNAKQNLFATYLSNQFKYDDDLSINLGVRFEHSVQRVWNYDDAQIAEIKKSDLLPVANVIYNLTENTNLRFAYSNTLSRPEFREMSSVKFEEYFGGRVVGGNPDLERTRITNLDLKYETFGNSGEMVSVSAFYKNFDNPVEMNFIDPTNNEVKPSNADDAFLYGVELETRYQLNSAFRIISNFSWIESEVNVGSLSNTVSKKRSLQGQSPYILNTSVYYAPQEQAYEFGVSYNRFGKRIATVGSYLHKGDEYELAFDKLDFITKYKFAEYAIKLNVKNILNSESKFTQQGVSEVKTTRSYKKGRSISVGVSHDF